VQDLVEAEREQVQALVHCAYDTRPSSMELFNAVQIGVATVNDSIFVTHGANFRFDRFHKLYLIVILHLRIPNYATIAFHYKKFEFPNVIWTGVRVWLLQ